MSKEKKDLLQEAVFLLNFEKVKELIASINIDTRYEDSRTLLHSVTRIGDYDSMCKLIELGAKVNAYDKFANTPLNYAIASNKCELKHIQLLINNGANVNSSNEDRRTMLQCAIDKGKAEYISLLSKARADVNVKDKDGKALLHHAIDKNQKECIAILIKAGADVNAKDKDGKTPLHHAIEQGKSEYILILKIAGANIDARDKDGKTPLHYAIDKVQVKCFSELIRLGANVNAKDKNGASLLHHAIHDNQQHFRDALIKAGAEVVAADKDGITIAHLAAAGNIDVVLESVIAGAEPNSTDNNGKTPRDYAKLHPDQNKTAKVCSLLEDLTNIDQDIKANQFWTDRAQEKSNSSLGN